MSKGRSKMTMKFLKRNHPDGTTSEHLNAMKRNLDAGMSYQKAHLKAVEDGHEVVAGSKQKQMVNLGSSLHSKVKKGELVPAEKAPRLPKGQKRKLKEEEVKQYAKGGVVKGAVKNDEGDGVGGKKNGSIVDGIPTSSKKSNNLSKNLFKQRLARAKAFPNSPAFNYELNGGYNIKSGVAFTGIESKGVPRMGHTPHLDGNYAFDGKESGMRQYQKKYRSQIEKETLGATQRRTNDNYNISGRHNQNKAYKLVQTDRNIGYLKKNKVMKPKKERKGLDYKDFNKWYIMEYANAMNGFRKKSVDKVLNKVMKERVRHSIDTMGNNLQGDRGGFYSSGFRSHINLKKVVSDDNKEPTRIIVEDEDVEVYDEYGDVDNYLPVKSNVNIWKNNREQRVNSSQSGGVGDYDRLSRRVFTNNFLKTGKVSAEN